MIWTKIIHATLELVTLFIVLELLQRRRELGYHPPHLPKEPRPRKPRSPLDCPFYRRPIPSRFGAMPTNPVWNPGTRRKSPRRKHKHVCTAGHACPSYSSPLDNRAVWGGIRLPSEKPEQRAQGGAFAAHFN